MLVITNTKPILKFKVVLLSILITEFRYNLCNLPMFVLGRKISSF